MADCFPMEYFQAFQDLARDLPRFRFSCPFILHIMAKIAVRDILHGYKYLASILVPAMEFHEQVFVLALVSPVIL